MNRSTQKVRQVTNEKRSLKKRPTGSVVDVFCGVGGLTHGFRQAGFEISCGIDIDEDCRYAFERNNGAPFVRRDVGALKADEVNRLFSPGHRRILVGCAPCQPFSTYNQKNEDPKWQLLRKFGNLIVGVRPDVVSMENVPRLLGFRGGAVFKQFVGKLREAGYYVEWDVLYCPDYGLAQNRSRLVLLASLLGPISLPQPTHLGQHRTVWDEIGSLPPLAHGECHVGDSLHRASGLSPTNLKRILEAKPGGTWRDWSPRLVAKCHQEESGRGYSSVYGRMKWDEPSPTITTQFFGFGNGRFGHPEQNRALSLREGAILQGFPPEYEFVAPGEKIHMSKVGRLIGNAVPVKLGAAIAGAVRSHLEDF